MEYYLVPEAGRPAWAVERCHSANSPAALICLVGLLKNAENSDTANEILGFADDA